MNTDTRNTGTEPHLDLEQLLAGVAGDPLGEPAREHLGSCPHCRTELRRWGTVSDGTRLLVAAAELPPWQFPAETTARRPGRRALLTAAAAAAVLAAAGGTTWGLASGGAAPAAALTAVTGCPGLAATSGTLEQVDGTRLMVRTQDGQAVTVTTSGSTAVSTEVAGSLSDITDGARVLVHGTPQGTTLAAQNVLANLAQLLPRQGRPSGKIPETSQAGPGPGIAAGTVSDVHAGGFTVTQLAGRPVHVTTSAATVVDMLTPSSAGQLRTGVHVIAVGQSGPDGTLAASAVEQGATLPQIETPPGRSATGTCNPAAVASTMAFGG
jgi:Domain of unknown function (DUF5666)